MTVATNDPPNPRRQGLAVIGIVGGVAVLLAISLLAFLPRIACACTPMSISPSGGANPTPDVRSPVDGVVLSVDSASLNDVRGFTLRPTNGGGFSFAFEVGDLENPTEFPLAHLAEHQATASPIRVYFRTENGRHIVYRLEDAPE